MALPNNPGSFPERTIIALNSRWFLVFDDTPTQVEIALAKVAVEHAKLKGSPGGSLNLPSGNVVRMLTREQVFELLSPVKRGSSESRAPDS